ncbi:MAG: cellobiose phosphorylase, partial [Candidatus Omnitrophota bacterium]|nr:cellobiose phosphorylase [Candidatus Omnitrophota bacterium]
MQENLWKFTDNLGSFESDAADKIKSLYFPLCNETLMSAITPDLHGDSKSGQNSFLLQPVSRIDLVNLRCSRNFWVYPVRNTKGSRSGKKISNGAGKVWSCCGVSKELKQIQQDSFKLKAGLLWQKISRENKRVGLRSETLSFIPASGEPIEIMQVRLTNISLKKIKLVPTAAIPIYGRGAQNLRDHRQVTSLLQRITLNKYGVIVKPTLSFNEAGHTPNQTNYFVLGWDAKGRAPRYIYPTQEGFTGEAGDLEAPESVLNNLLPQQENIQGKEAMGGLRFPALTLSPGQSRSFIIAMGISDGAQEIKAITRKFNSSEKVQAALRKTKDYWAAISRQIHLASGNPDFDNWFRWVSIQPTLRRIFGCSFLPDFDYGKGGRGWRDLWQDCLGLILNNPVSARELLINNFAGVRIDGSNATVIGKNPGEFVADRNNISRVWMDHGAWPLLTLDLYLHETGDFAILLEEAPYFRNHQINRAAGIDARWSPEDGQRLKTAQGKIYCGTVIEHLLVENLAQFFNVGAHNYLRLEGADWNDGLDMAKENGESVAFTAMYGHNLKLLAGILRKLKHPKINVAKELKILLQKIDYSDIQAKRRILSHYFAATEKTLSGERVDLDAVALAEDLEAKAESMLRHIRKSAWLKEGFFNGYYDNHKERVEGRKGNLIRMSLTSQVFPIMSGAAEAWQVRKILRSAKQYLRDKRSGGIRLNSDFKQEQRELGRAFSFSYGDKENGAVFNHMAVMFASALYKRGFVEDAGEILLSLYRMCAESAKSKIYPCLPEYFNLEGRGMYAYLTGSASWFVLTMLTQAFGVRGQDGDLLIEPGLSSAQFQHSALISIEREFAGRRFRVSFFNPQKLNSSKYKIIKASLNHHNLPLENPSQL